MMNMGHHFRRFLIHCAAQVSKGCIRNADRKFYSLGVRTSSWQCLWLTRYTNMTAAVMPLGTNIESLLSKRKGKKKHDVANIGLILEAI